jgi:hypothetical protein
MFVFRDFLRMGIYTSLFDMVSTDGKPPNFLTKAGIGMAAGSLLMVSGGDCDGDDHNDED